MDLETIEQRTNAATQGPWKRSAEQDDTPVVYRNHPAVAGAAEVIFTADWGTEADAEFTAHARQDVPDLVARVRELEKSVRVHRESITRLDSIKSERGARIVELEEENQKLRDTAAVARYVADHWREAAATNGWPVAAHPLSLVLAALGGETDPEQLGLNEEDRAALGWARDIAGQET